MDFLLKEVGSCKDLALEGHSISVVCIRDVDPDREEGSGRSTQNAPLGVVDDPSPCP